MEKLFTIMVLSLLISGCSKKERSDEFGCKYSDGSGPVLITITNDFIKFNKGWGYPIKEENDEKITAVGFQGSKGEQSTTFYKRTKKLKLVIKDMEPSTFLLSCDKLN